MSRSVVRSPGSRRLWIAGFGVAALVDAATGVVFGMGVAQAAGTFNVRNYGAAGNGTTNDGSAIQSVTVAVAVDTRIGRRSWMDASWTDTGTHLTNSESTPRSFEVFEKTFPAGTVSLGPNGDAGSSTYTVIVF